MSTASAFPLSGQELNDPNRLEALRATGLLDSISEVSFDRYTECMRLALACDVSLVSLVDERRQFFKSQSGLGEPLCSIRETPLSYSFCQYVVTRGQSLRITDARIDPLVRDSPAVSEFGVIAYLGAPIRSSDGFVLGSLCAIDKSVREWTPNDNRFIELMAESVMAEIRLRDISRVIVENLDQRIRAERERDSIIHAMVHDMRTPLASIVSSLELLGNDLPLDHEQLDLLSIMRSTSDQLLEMMNGLLEVNRLESGHPLTNEQLDVNKMLRHVFQTVKPIADEAGHNLTVNYPPVFASISGDESILSRVLLNLLSNAIKFCPRGSRIAMSAETTPEGCLFSVRDNGPGIPDSDKAEIFGKHVRGKNRSATQTSSFGLGLDFCKNAVEAHSGKITVNDAEGGGTTFAFTIPVGSTGSA